MAQQPRPPTAYPAAFAWEGDSTLHSYTYDYMRKRGWIEAASRFAQEAGIDEATWTGPPIEAPQGLLYEWWSVFWDVFIARSQKSGPRNPNADAYVEAMRAKREPLIVSFAGPHATPSMNLPRSLAHPPRLASNAPAYVSAGGPPRATYSQMHVLEQQELQRQMQQQRGRVQQLQGGPGGRPLPPPVEGSYPPGAGPQRVMHLSPQQQQQAYGHPNPLAAQEQTHPRQLQGAPAGAGAGGPQSVHGSPQILPAPHPYTNGRPPEAQGGGGGGAGALNPAFAAAMAAVGLAGRDPESLSGEEHGAIAAQMRRMGALPPTVQNPATRQQQMGIQVRMVQQPPPPQRMPSDPQSRMYFPPPQPQQQQQQQLPPPQQRVTQYAHVPPPQNAASPASPSYNSPYSTPHVAHMQIPPQQQQHMQQQGVHSSPPHDFSQAPLPLPMPPPSRSGPPQAQGKKPGPQQQQQQGAQGLPAANGPPGKRSGFEDPSPRTRKRPRPGTRGEGADEPGTPGFEHQLGGAGAGSPATMPGGGGQAFAQDQMQGAPPPYRPSPSPGLMQPPPPRSFAPQQQQQYLGGNGDPNGVGGMGMNGAPPQQQQQPGMANGSLSRPASAMSNHHLSPGGSHQHFSPASGMGAPGPGPGPEQRASPVPPQTQMQMHMSMQMAGSGGGGDLSGRQYGGSQPHSATSTPLPPPPQALPPAPESNGGGGGGGANGANGFGLGTDELFNGLDGGLDFETFLNNDMFTEDAAT
ncbi:hypothetical protein JCM3770_004502 [Rhodotorula araucariae]